MFINRRLVIAKGLAVYAMTFFIFSFSAHAFTISVTYDTTVTTNVNAAQFETAFGLAVQTIETLYTNPITVNIKVYWGTNGASNPFSGGISLSRSDTQAVGAPGFGYPQLTNALRATRISTAQSNAVASLPASDPTPNGSTWYVPRSEAKALNLTSLGVSQNDSVNDGAVGFTTDSDVVFDFSTTNRAGAGEFDFIGCAEHEITEVLGRTSFGLDENGNYIPFDLFRFTGNGARSMSAGDTNVYFSINDGATVLDNYNLPGNGGDLQDWESPSDPPDSFDAFAIDGDENTLSDADLIVMNILGYDLSYKAPVQAVQQLSNGHIQLTFTNNSGMSLSIITTTNPAAALTNWMTLGTPTESPVGHYQYTDTHAATNSLRLYSVILQLQ